MGKYSDLISETKDSIIGEIVHHIESKGKKSKHCGGKCIDTNYETSYNMDGDRWLDEFGETHIMDNEGYSYGYHSLSVEQLAEIADYCESLK